MRVITLTAKAGKDGKLRLEVPDADAGTEYEVAVVLTAKPSVNDRHPTPDELGWPKGYFEATFGSIADEGFERPPQPSLRPVGELSIS